MTYYVAKFNIGLCTGCEACVQACPRKAITMKMNEEGFFYPDCNNDQCNGCGLCGNVCPEALDQSISRHPLPKLCLAAIHKDRGVLKASSSGGAFSAIVSALDDSCIIFGAAFDEDLTVSHSAIYDKSQIGKLRKSKYVQSRIYNCYNETMLHLQNSRQVLFTGTPCQIAGLRKFLGQDYDRLICVEVVCHGVGSPGVFADYLNACEKMIGSRPVKIIFRDKRSFLGGWKDFLTTTYFRNGRRISTRFNPYTRGFLNCLFLRTSCLSCSYSNKMRVSDILIGDFWGIERKRPELYCKDGISLVFPITPKGKELCGRLSAFMSLAELPSEDAFEENKVLIGGRGNAEGRDTFFETYRKNGIEIAFSKHISKIGILSRTLSYLPEDIKNILRKLKKRN